MALQNEYKFFEAVEKSFDKAAKFTSLDPGVLEQIKQCNSVYRMFFPVKIGDKDRSDQSIPGTTLPSQIPLQRGYPLFSFG